MPTHYLAVTSFAPPSFAEGPTADKAASNLKRVVNGHHGKLAYGYTIYRVPVGTRVDSYGALIYPKDAKAPEEISNRWQG